MNFTSWHTLNIFFIKVGIPWRHLENTVDCFLLIDERSRSIRDVILYLFLLHIILGILIITFGYKQRIGFLLHDIYSSYCNYLYHNYSNNFLLQIKRLCAIVFVACYRAKLKSLRHYELKRNFTSMCSFKHRI